MPPSPPLRTVRESFDSYRSSLTNALCRTRFLSTLLIAFTIRACSRRTFCWARLFAPAFQFAGNCTSRFRFCHLLCFLSRFLKLSRDVRPRGSLPAFAWGDIALFELNPYPPHYRAAFAFSPLLYPLPHRGHLALPLPRGTALGLPRSVYIPVRVRSHLFAGGASSASDETTAPDPDHLPFGSSVSTPFACQHSRRLSVVHIC